MVKFNFEISTLDVDIASEDYTYKCAQDSHDGIDRGRITIQRTMREGIKSRLTKVYQPTKAGNHTVYTAEGGKAKHLGGIVTM